MLVFAKAKKSREQFWGYLPRFPKFLNASSNSSSAKSERFALGLDAKTCSISASAIAAMDCAFCGEIMPQAQSCINDSARVLLIDVTENRSWSRSLLWWTPPPKVTPRTLALAGAAMDAKMAHRRNTPDVSRIVNAEPKDYKTGAQLP